METMASPYKTPIDNPSRQLLHELSRLSLVMHDDFYERLNKENKLREIDHRNALVSAAAEHSRIRRSAEIEREKLELQLDAERRRREAEETRDLEKRRQEKVDRDAEERREAETKRQEKVDRDVAKKRREDELAELQRRRIAEEQKFEEVKRAKKDWDDAELRRRLKAVQDAEAQKKTDQLAHEAARGGAQRQQQSTHHLPPNLQNRNSQPRTTPLVPADSKAEAEHQKYIEIHRNLKNLREMVKQGVQHDSKLKERIGDMRREIKKCVGQLISGKGANRAPLHQLISIFRDGLQLGGPKVDAHMFLASDPDFTNPNGPAFLFYFLNIFAKAVICQFIDEAGVSPKAADAVGIVASHIFAFADFRWEGESMIDILIAKMHVVCPVIWGIYGDESTTEGKNRIGWWQEEKNTKSPTWISSQEHNQRMTGLGAGFAAISLRNYEKARLENPYPSMHYWKAISTITNVPPQLVTQTHFVVLKALIESYEQKFLEFYGNAALAALRVALVDFPQRVNHQSVAAKALVGLADVLRRDLKLSL